MNFSEYAEIDLSSVVTLWFDGFTHNDAQLDTQDYIKSMLSCDCNSGELLHRYEDRHTRNILTKETIVIKETKIRIKDLIIFFKKNGITPPPDSPLANRLSKFTDDSPEILNDAPDEIVSSFDEIDKCENLDTLREIAKSQAAMVTSMARQRLQPHIDFIRDNKDKLDALEALEIEMLGFKNAKQKKNMMVLTVAQKLPPRR